MLNMLFKDGSKNNLNILCIGAHSDDIEIGCGGSILRLIRQYKNVEVHWVVLGPGGKRKMEAITSANKILSKAKRKRIITKNFKDSYFPYTGGEIKDIFNLLKKEISPDIIFTHYRHDLHQDHRFVSELTWNAFRDHLILEYEIIKYDGDIGVPNFYIHLDEAICHDKVRIIMDAFKSQKEKDWFKEDVFFSILRIRGIESKSPYKYAEGFYSRKMIF